MAKKTTLKDFIVEFFVFGVLANIVASLFVSVKTRLLFGIITFVGLLLVLLVLYYTWLRRRLKVLNSGANGYYYSFPLEENPKVWEEVVSSFYYLGISSDTIMPFFQRWIESLPANNTILFKFLLMNPDATSLKTQLCFRHNFSDSSLTPEQESQLNQEIATLKGRIISSVKLLQQTHLYKQGRLEIKYYDEFIPWWLYILNEDRGYVGILEKGKDGKDSPVLILRKDKKHANVFTAFFHTWERMWKKAQNVEVVV